MSLPPANSPDSSTLNPKLVFASLILAAFFWGWSFPLTKMMTGAFPAITLAALRGLTGAAMLIVFFIVIRQNFPPRSAREIIDWLVLGALNGWIANTLVAYATQTLPAGQAAMIQACGPLLTAQMAHRLFSDEKLTRARLFGILIGFVGVALLIGPRMVGQNATPGAALAMLGVAFCYAAGNIYVRMMPVADPRRLALGQQLTSGLAATLIALGTVGTASFTAVPDNIVLLLALGVFSTALPIVVFMYILRAAGPTRASLTGYLVPAWAVVISAMVLGETIGLRGLIAGAIVLVGVYIVTRARASARGSAS